MQFTISRLTFSHERLPKEVAIIEGEILYPNEALPNGESDSQERIRDRSIRFNATKRVIREGHHVFTVIWRDAGRFPWQSKR